MLYITGDTHCELSRLEYILFNSGLKFSEDDYFVVCGDFGYMNTEKSKTDFLNLTKNLSFKILFIDGNHDNHDYLTALPVEIWNGGKIHRISNNTIHLMRGQYYSIDESSFFTMGGGYSNDRIYRQEGVSWWNQEMPSSGEYEEGCANLLAHDNKVDYILTHTAPIDTIARLRRDAYYEELYLNNWLEFIRETVEYKHWFFGHFHRDEFSLWRNQTALYFNIVSIENNCIKYIEL